MNSDYEPRRVHSETRLHDGETVLPIGTVEDFWFWSASDLRENTLRGIFAEYLVALKLGLTEKPRIEWAPYDLEFKGKKIEVKSSGYVQAWTKTKKDNSPSWNVGPTKKWCDGKGWVGERKRRADLYIFCLQREEDPSRYDATDVTQWRFWVVPTLCLLKEEKTRRTNANYALKSLSLTALKNLGGKAICFDELKRKTESVINEIEESIGDQCPVG